MENLGVEWRSGKSGGVRPTPFYTLQYRRGELQQADSIALFCFHANRNAARLGKRIRNHFKLLPVKANALTGAVPPGSVALSSQQL
jgi:hypothetical protein